MAKHQSRSKRRVQLFEAALEVCAEKGYHAATIEEIASRAGLSKGSLYHHFESKQELFLSLLEQMIDYFKEQTLGFLDRSLSASDALRQVIRMFVSWAKSNPGLMRGMVDFYLLGARDPRFRQTFLGYYEQLVKVGAQIIQRGIDRGELTPQLDPERVAWLLFTAGDGLFLVHLTMGQEQQGIERLMALTELILRGLRNDRTADAGGAAAERQA